MTRVRYDIVSDTHEISLLSKKAGGGLTSSGSCITWRSFGVNDFLDLFTHFLQTCIHCDVVRHDLIVALVENGLDLSRFVVQWHLKVCFGDMVDNYCSIKARGAVGMEVKGLSQTNRSFASARSNAEKTSAERPLVIALDEEMEEGFDLSPYRERLSLAINEMDGGLFRGICREIVNVFESGGVSLLSAITATNGIFILVLSMTVFAPM